MFNFITEQQASLSLIGKRVQLIDNPQFSGICTAIKGGSVFIDGQDTCIDIINYELCKVTELQEGEVLSSGKYGMVWS